MPSTFRPNHDAVRPAEAAASATPAPSVAPAAHVTPSASPATAQAETVSRTLQVVRDVSERIQAKAAQNVQFSVSFRSGEQLSVSLQYRGGVMHTTFNTDSTELRNAIARHWQTQMPTSVDGDGSVRLAAPSFGGAQDTRSSLDLGGQQRQQQSFQQQSAQDSSSRSQSMTSSSRGTRQAPARTASTTEEAPAARPLVSDTSRHLHTFA